MRMWRNVSSNVQLDLKVNLNKYQEMITFERNYMENIGLSGKYI